ncbi:plasma-membrane choline transporter-domain-containing protein [Phanerochaete sordida]|uniref:Protein PNS1 n=1 Tax=Phanerochaete sordida TaxID=48140 RepID=A0A9P3LCY5_9APHY|nr:plasma-membrane choline transporter-domain-containing protein [Phanerochaete sordida]
MAASFAAYASQFLNRQQGASSSLSSSQPLFFSFTSDGGSRAGNPHDADLDDLDDPHLRASEHMSRHTVRDMYAPDDSDDDPYLRLDEEEAGVPRPSHSTRLLDASDPGGSKGWLAHASPLRSPSPPLSTSSVDSRPPPRRTLSPPLSPPPPQQPRFAQPPPPPRTAPHLSLTESLLRRDGPAGAADVFSLPDPRYISRGRRKYNDSAWISAWLAGVGVCYFCSLLMLFVVRRPSKKDQHGAILPYITLLHTVPLTTILIILSAAVSYAHILLLRIFVKPVMVVTSVFIPATLFISAVWAFIGSFMWDGDTEPTWGETVGLRLFALIPLAFSLLTARRLVHLPREIHTASSLLTLTTRILVANPFLLALSPAVLLAELLVSLPFATLAFRLLLVGYARHPLDRPTGWEWHVYSWANWAIAGTVCVWLWTWGVGRGLLRVTCAGVVGSWYFANPDLPQPPPTSTHTIHAALFRATQPSLGSICLSALILAGVRLLGLTCMALRALPAYLPPYMRFVSVGAAMLVSYLENVTNTLSTYALVYLGLTGDAFFPSARRARALTSTVETSAGARYRQKFKTEPPLTMLTVAPLTLTFPFSLTTYLFVAHTLNAPDQALAAAVLAGAITALVGLFCVGLVKDTADTLYMCYCIDKDIGARHRDEVFETFEYDNPSRPAQPQPNRPSNPRQPSRPQEPRRTGPVQPAPQMPVPQPQPQLSTNEPRRTTRLEPAAREETPDPFESSPTDPFSPQSSPDVRHPQEQSHLEASEPVPHISLHHPPPDSEDEEVEESQLFPGSDLF